MNKTRRRFKKKKAPPQQAAANPQQQPGAVAQGSDAPPPRIQNQILAGIEQHLEGQIVPKYLDAYKRIVNAGMRVGLKGGPNSLVASLKQSQDPVSDCAKGAVNLVLMLYRQSRYTMPPQAIPPAATTLMLEALDFAERLGKVQVDAAVMERATHIFTNQLMAGFRVTPDQLHQLAGKVHGVMNDPTAMDTIARRVGVVRSPMAGTMTPLPPSGQGET